jgi:hypothetical protein
MVYFKDSTDNAMVASFNLSSATRIDKNPETYPKNCRDSSFSIDIREGKDIKTYYWAANSVAERDHWLASIVAWRKYTTNLNKGGAKGSFFPLCISFYSPCYLF